MGSMSPMGVDPARGLGQRFGGHVVDAEVIEVAPAPAAPRGPSMGQKRACIEREIKQRRRVYPRLVAAGKMSQAFADEQTAIMEAILADYPAEPPAQGEMFR